MHKYLLSLFLFLLSGAITAQIEADTATYEVEEQEQPEEDFTADYAEKAEPTTLEEGAGSHPFTTDAYKWKRATEGLDYSDEKKEKEEKKRDLDLNIPQPDADLGHWWSNALQGLAILVAVLLIAFGVYYTTTAPRDKKIKGVYDISIEQIEERLHETDLMRYLREALAQKDYAVATRLYYLQMLKDLSASGHIRWAKAKTNRSYMLELTNHKLHPQMLENTRMYETVWFGNTTLTEAGFKAIEPAFRDILHQTGNSLNPTA
jgi:hypothetical protein